MSPALIALVGIVVLFLLAGGGLAVALYLKNSGKPRMSRWERTAVNRRVSSHMQKLAEESACKSVMEAMGYETAE